MPGIGAARGCPANGATQRMSFAVLPLEAPPPPQQREGVGGESDDDLHLRQNLSRDVLP